MRFIGQMYVVEECRLTPEHFAILQPGDGMADKGSNADRELFNKIHTPVLRDTGKPDNSRRMTLIT